MCSLCSRDNGLFLFLKSTYYYRVGEGLFLTGPSTGYRNYSDFIIAMIILAKFIIAGSIIAGPVL